MNQQEALSRVGKFLRSLARTSPSPGDRFDFETIFYRKGHVSVALDDGESREYRAVLAGLREAVRAKRYLTPRLLERLVQSAVFAIYETSNLASPARETEVRAALKALRNELDRKPDAWTVYLPVTGVEVARKAISFGRVKFHKKDVAFRRSIMRSVEAVISTGTNTEDVKDDFRRDVSDGLDHLEAGGIVADVTVLALDAEGAEVEARHVATEVAAALSFFADVRSLNFTVIHIGEDPGRKFRNALVLRKDAGLSLSSAVEGPGRPLSLSDLRSSSVQAMQARWVSRVLEKESRTEVEQRFLSAIVWCGRARQQERRELRFLLYAVALETLLLPKRAEGELGYRLRSRAAHILAKTVEQRTVVASEVRDLYGLRSSIVHTGAESVTDAQLQLIRFFATNSVLHCIGTHGLQKLTMNKELEDWFERKILS